MTYISDFVVLPGQRLHCHLCLVW